MTYIPYNKNLKELSRKLRSNSTLGEIILWRRLSGRKCCGLQFLRQKPLGKYIVDFYCIKINLVIEIDGYSHSFKNIHHRDIKKQKALERMGLNVLRFTEGQARNETNHVLEVIEAFVQSQSKSP